MVKLWSDAERILREAWMKAYRQEDGLTLECKTQSRRNYLRLRMYKIAAKVRENPEMDAEFATAVEQLSIEGVGDTGFRIGKSALVGALGDLAKELEFDPQAADKEALQGIEARLRGEVLGMAPATAAVPLAKPRNPYNTREE